MFKGDIADPCSKDFCSPSLYMCGHEKRGPATGVSGMSCKEYYVISIYIIFTRMCCPLPIVQLTPQESSRIHSPREASVLNSCGHGVPLPPRNLVVTIFAVSVENSFACADIGPRSQGLHAYKPSHSSHIDTSRNSPTNITKWVVKGGTNLFFWSNPLLWER